MTPVWLALDGDDVVFTTGDGSVKSAALRRDPRAMLCVDDQEPFYSYVLLEEEASLSDDLDAVRRWATVVGGRYTGLDRAEEFGARNAEPGELLVRLRVTKVLAFRDIAA